MSAGSMKGNSKSDSHYYLQTSGWHLYNSTKGRITEKLGLSRKLILPEINSRTETLTRFQYETLVIGCYCYLWRPVKLLRLRPVSRWKQRLCQIGWMTRTTGVCRCVYIIYLPVSSQKHLHISPAQIRSRIAHLSFIKGKKQFTSLIWFHLGLIETFAHVFNKMATVLT